MFDTNNRELLTELCPSGKVHLPGTTLFQREAPMWGHKRYPCLKGHAMKQKHALRLAYAVGDRVTVKQQGSPKFRVRVQYVGDSHVEGTVLRTVGSRAKGQWVAVETSDIVNNKQYQAPTDERPVPTDTDEWDTLNMFGPEDD